MKAVNSMDDELFDFVAGELLGQGQYREVYAVRGDPTRVLKVEREARAFHNIKEYHVWQEVCEWEKGRKWLAPVFDISAHGKYLVQARTVPVLARDLPKLIPAFFTDTKHQNWGRLPDGRVVCHDFGSMRLTLKAHLVKADWWNG